MGRVLSRRVLAVVVLVTVVLLGCGGDPLPHAEPRLREGVRAQDNSRAGLHPPGAAHYQAGISLVQGASAHERGHADTDASLAWRYFAGGQYLRATMHFREALAHEPNSAALHEGLGWARYRLARYHLALGSFRHALALSPGYRDARIGFAYCLFELGRYAEALPHLEQLTADEDRTPAPNPTSDHTQVRSRLAWALFYLGNFREAQAQFRKGLARHPEWPGLHNGLGWSLLRGGDPVAAHASFARALELQPDYADAQEGLAVVQAKR